VFGEGEAIVPKFIKTPYGKAVQSESFGAMNARNQLTNGAWIYRGGKLGKSAGPEGQFWSLENPLTPGYSERYGLPAENTQFDFIEVAVLNPNSNYITREAPGIGINGGGGIEVVVNSGEPKLKYFHMPWEQKYDSDEQRIISRNK
jgi:filamentous hemagglutinin